MVRLCAWHGFASSRRRRALGASPGCGRTSRFPRRRELPAPEPILAHRFPNPPLPPLRPGGPLPPLAE